MLKKEVTASTQLTFVKGVLGREGEFYSGPCGSFEDGRIKIEGQRDFSEEEKVQIVYFIRYSDKERWTLV